MISGCFALPQRSSDCFPANFTNVLVLAPAHCLSKIPTLVAKRFVVPFVAIGGACGVRERRRQARELGMQLGGSPFREEPEPPSSAALGEAWRPHVETCIEAFGARRSLFESNFPVDKGFYSYPVFWNACKILAAGVGEKADRFAWHRGVLLPPQCDCVSATDLTSPVETQACPPGPIQTTKNW